MSSDLIPLQRGPRPDVTDAERGIVRAAALLGVAPFRSALRFDSDCTTMVFSKTWLDHVPPGHDAELHRALQREIVTQEMLNPDDQVERIRRTLRTMVPSGRVSATLISRLVSIPTRTLRRVLAAQGTSFRELLETVRYEIARQLLADTDMATTDIAEALGYADSSAFTRAFRRWTNAPPAAWRAKMRSAADARRVALRAQEKSVAPTRGYESATEPSSCVAW